MDSFIMGIFYYKNSNNVTSRINSHDLISCKINLRFVVDFEQYIVKIEIVLSRVIFLNYIHLALYQRYLLKIQTKAHQS
jgi:hypothetical protein